MRKPLKSNENVMERRCFSGQYLFVDEAAGIPVAEALRLMRSARRVVMATTLDGYDARFSSQKFVSPTS